MVGDDEINVPKGFAPIPTVLNAARIEDTHGDFEFYIEGVTPSVARMLESIDRERIAVAEAMGFRALSAREGLYIAYDAAGRNLYEAMRANPGYRNIQAPPTINHRYLNEDVPMPRRVRCLKCRRPPFAASSNSPSQPTNRTTGQKGGRWNGWDWRV